MFQALKYMDKPTPPLTRAPSPQRMSSMTLGFIDARADQFRQSYHNRNMERILTKAVIKLLVVDTHRREEIAAEDIRDFLETSQGTTSDI